VEGCDRGMEFYSNENEAADASKAEVSAAVIINNKTAGIVSYATIPAQFHHLLLSGNDIGLKTVNGEAAIDNALIVKNRIGVYATGVNPGIVDLKETRECPKQSSSSDRFTNVQTRWSWGRDPVITNSEISDNKEHGVFIDATVKVVVGSSNLKNNGLMAVYIYASAIDKESAITNCNIYNNNGNQAVQIKSYHREGILDLSSNYWIDISDPELHQNWDTTNTYTINKVCTYNEYQWGKWEDGERSEGSYSKTFTGEVSFTNFSHDELNVGPNHKEMTPSVEETYDKVTTN
jgi:hypothetical protein